MFKLNALVLAMAALASTSALAVNETEDNDCSGSGPNQVVTFVGNPSVVDALMGSSGADVDYYTFSGKKGETVTIDVDHGFKGFVTGSVNLTAALFDSEGNILDLNETASTVDEGSVGAYDPYMTYELPATGTYTVGIVNSGRSFEATCKVTVVSRSPSKSTGTYELLITREAPSVLDIGMVVRPGSNDLVYLNPKSKGKIPVALLGSADFNPTDVDTTTLRFGHTGEETSFVKCDDILSDVNGDGLMDRVCHFSNQDAHFTETDVQAFLTGATKDGQQFKAESFLKAKRVSSGE